MIADVELLLDPVSSKYEYNSRDLQGVTTILSVCYFYSEFYCFYCVCTEWYMAARRPSVFVLRHT